jgi:hypothetical protein
LDRRRQLYPLSGLLSDVARILALSQDEISRYRQALVARVRAPASD